MNLPRDFELQSPALRHKSSLNAQASLARRLTAASCGDGRNGLLGLTCVFFRNVIVRLGFVLYKLVIVGGRVGGRRKTRQLALLGGSGVGRIDVVFVLKPVSAMSPFKTP